MAREIYRKIIQRAGEVLRRGGYLVMEIGIGMEDRVLNLFGEEWDKLPAKTDLQGIPRTVIAKCRPGTNRRCGADLPQS